MCLIMMNEKWVVTYTTPIKLHSFASKVLDFAHDVWTVAENYKASSDEEICLKKGQLVEVLVRAHGSSRWRVRVLLDNGTASLEGWVPYTTLRRSDDDENRRKRHSDISHSSSEGEQTSSGSPVLAWRDAWLCTAALARESAGFF